MSGCRLPAVFAACVICAGVAAFSSAPATAVVTPQHEIDALRTAAAAGDAAAMYALGTTYALGKGVAKDFVQAAAWYRKAAAAGNTDGMVHLGHLYENGFGVPHDHEQAAAWYRKGADLGDASAMFYLGIAYWAGRGVTQDFVEAYKWLDLASARASDDERKRDTDARDLVAKGMAPQLIAEAQKRARLWQAAFESRKI